MACNVLPAFTIIPSESAILIFNLFDPSIISASDVFIICPLAIIVTRRYIDPLEIAECNGEFDRIGIVDFWEFEIITFLEFAIDRATQILAIEFAQIAFFDEISSFFSLFYSGLRRCDVPNSVATRRSAYARASRIVIETFKSRFDAAIGRATVATQFIAVVAFFVTFERAIAT